MFRLASPEASYQLEQAQASIRVLRLQIERTGGSPELLDLRLVLEEQLGEARAALQAATDSLDQLSIRAPISGVVSELEEWLQPGRWLGEKQPLALIVQSDGAQAEALVSEQDLGRLSPGATGRFYPENTDLPPVEVTLERIDRAGLLALSRPYLASVYGGAVPVRKDASGRLAPEQSLYRLSLATSESPPAPQRIERGTLRLAAEARSPVRRLWDAAMGVLVRESGF
jgi:putative peptide zinc metalloprotease protein